jgi:MtrB/PioB family decaheme-associated outer membrane protein
MRIPRSLLPLVLLAVTSAPVAAQEPAGSVLAARPLFQQPSEALGALDIGEVDVGLRLTGTSDDLGRYQRFRDDRSGPTLDRLRYSRNRETWAFSARVDHAGYRDQRYAVEFNRFGRVKGSFEWSQVPLLYGNVTQSPFREDLAGVFRLDDSLQAAVQSGTATTADYASVLRRFETRSRRDVAAARFTYAATPALDLSLAFRSTGRTGAQPWGASFGFNNATELAAPVDQRTNDLATAAEWSNRRGMVRVAYDASWFRNGVDTLIWDNPLRITDQTTGTAYITGQASSQGRMALWPDSSAHTVSASGSIKLPARSRAFGSVSVGTWLQDQQLLAHTINAAVAPILLPRPTAEAEARITSMTYRVTSRPANSLWLNAQYRLYDYDNRTPHFAVEQYVRLDGVAAASATGGSEPFGYTRHFADLDASFTPLRFVAFRAGYGLERDERTFRVFENTSEHTVRASIDSTAFSWGSLRFQYDHAVRTGDGLYEQVFSDIGEQVSLRQFDISDRTRDRVSAIVQVMPIDMVGVSASVAVGQEHRPNAAFGLQDNDLRAITVGVDVTPSDAVAWGVSYGFENYSTLQQSRQANPGPQFDDPTRDWWTDMSEHVNTLSFNLNLLQLTERTAAVVAYDFVGSRSVYLYLLRPETTLDPISQLPAVRNSFHVAHVDVRHALTRHLALGAGYRFDHYDVEDFARSPGTLNSPLIPAFMNLTYQLSPYDVHTGTLRLIYAW